MASSNMETNTLICVSSTRAARLAVGMPDRYILFVGCLVASPDAICMRAFGYRGVHETALDRGQHEAVGVPGSRGHVAPNVADLLIDMPARWREVGLPVQRYLTGLRGCRCECYHVRLGRRI